MTSATSAPKTNSDHRRYSRLGYAAVGVVFFGLGVFSYFAPLDSAAIAGGRVSAETSTKPLQHLEGGIVREILVTETAHVKSGDVLFRLQPTQAEANSEALKKQIDAALALETRLAAERDGLAVLTFPEALMARREVPETAAAIADQTQQFAERRQSTENQTMILKARADQSVREIEGLVRQEASLKEQIGSLSTELANVSGLAKKGFYPKNKLMALEREQSRLEGQLAGIQGDIARKREVIAEAQLQMRQVSQTIREQASGQLADVRNKLSDLNERLTVAADVMSRVEIRAPQDGIVQGIKVRGPGAVVRPGETIAELVPTGEKLVIAARVSPLDMDSVMPGQTAEVRFPAFSARQLPIILGTVERLGADAMTDEATRETYYPARVVVDPATLPEGLSQRLVPGMPADVLIATGGRTMFQYLTGPLTDLFKKSMRES
ncbi:MAG: HlyD family type I secretion periplasmic adaptor subunit [Hyphomicrobium sp.]